MTARAASVGGRPGDNGQASVREEMIALVSAAIEAVCPPGGAVMIVDMPVDNARGTTLTLSPASLPYLENLRAELRRRGGSKYHCALGLADVAAPANGLTSLGTRQEKTVIVWRMAGERRTPAMQRLMHGGGALVVVGLLGVVAYYLLLLPSRAAMGDL